GADAPLVWALPSAGCAGGTMSTRVAGSPPRAGGLPDLVTASLQDYEALARNLATQRSLLQSYRSRLAANRRTAPLFDVTGYARGFEDALLRLSQSHRTGTPD